ncbi:MAG TPA: metallophosphoesterase [Vicinamibacterales bacterium]|nr:metallophosphoesterase [Vicinamibacterales bacterium]
MRRIIRRATALAAAALLVFLAACKGRSSSPDAERSSRITVQELSPAPGQLALPLKSGSIRFAVIGDAGRGDQAQNEVAQQMVAWRQQFPFEFVVMLGDNIYPPHAPDDFEKKFEAPYRSLLDEGIAFYAAIGNHDPDTELTYPKFNMEGRRYYTFRRNERRLEGLTGAGVRFFVLDSRSFDPTQLVWLREQLAQSGTDWKICYFHHPLYTSGRYTTAARFLRIALEPILIEGNVDVVLTGHEHFYERMYPQQGIAYFISGGGGSLRNGDIRRPSPIMARGFDSDFHFMMIEVSGDTLYFQAISRKGETIDAGSVSRAH